MSASLVPLLNAFPTTGTTPVATPAVPLGDEDQAGFQLSTDGGGGSNPGTLDGDWAIFCSAKATLPVRDGTEVDITSNFSPTIAHVDHTDPKKARQFIQCQPLIAGYIWAVFTPTAGNGRVTVNARIG